MSLMVSISGVRGVVGETLTPDVIVKYASAFGQYCDRGKIVIGRDGRSTGRIIGNLVSSTLMAMGCDVIALGIAPTPTIAIAVEQLRAAGGISITASHNPMQWNGLKFMGSSGMFLNAQENDRFWELANAQQRLYVPWGELGNHLADDSYLRQHIDMVINLPYLRLDRIRQKRFKVVVDCINAAGGAIVPHLLRELGCQVIEMNCEMSGIFNRMPEPVPENLGDLCERVRTERADLGIAVDPDVDRLVLITEKGEPFGEEYTITSVVKFILEKHKYTPHQLPLNYSPSVVVNLSTTKAVDDVARSYGVKVLRTPVGEINVSQKMKECGALVGGEGSGGVILPSIHYGRDAIVGIGLIMQQLTEFGGTLSQLKASLPQYFIIKSKVGITQTNPDDLMERLKQRYGSNGKINIDDGLKIEFSNSWIHLRKSNTEPIIRIIAEAPSVRGAEDLVEQFKREIV
ncbi:MAG: phosphoglucosamine mutase [Ignavibacteria bacterium]|nr:phosphoglucosamine mutase [Ignavibacteria bacterium]